MTVKEWLLNGDESISRLVKVHLLGQKSVYVTSGWIGKYLQKYDPVHKQWAYFQRSTTNVFGGGIYSPKWISTFYTLRELTILEIDPKNQTFQEGMNTLHDYFWNDSVYKVKDICVVGMLLVMAIYASWPQKDINDITNYLLNNQLIDGGFNCESTRKVVKSSSIHTTLSVLEGLSALINSFYEYNKIVIVKVISEANDFILRKHLMKRESNHQLLFPAITSFHYPSRWKYDILKGLEYFALNKCVYDIRMDEALDILYRRFKRGILPKGPMHTGLLHFPLESEDIKRMNTFRGLRVLKEYHPQLFHTILNTTVL